MNKLIQELSKQARDAVLKDMEIFREAGLSQHDNKWAELYNEKFAELIVRECARISIEADDTMTNQGAASAGTFMEHFGVEE